MARQAAALEKTKESLNRTEIPSGAGIDKEGDALSTNLDQEMEKQSIVLEKLNSVMTPEVFIKNTTTRNLFIETTRKTIVPVDNALKAYHTARTRENLIALASALKTYLARSDSKRVPYALLLQSQVKSALAALDSGPPK